MKAIESHVMPLRLSILRHSVVVPCELIKLNNIQIAQECRNWINSVTSLDAYDAVWES